MFVYIIFKARFGFIYFALGYDFQVCLKLEYHISLVLYNVKDPEYHVGNEWVVGWRIPYSIPGS